MFTYRKLSILYEHACCVLLVRKFGIDSVEVRDPDQRKLLGRLDLKLKKK